MLYRIKRKFVELIVIGYIITECMVLLEGTNDLINTVIPPTKTSSEFKLGIIQEDDSQRMEPSIIRTGNEYEDDTNKENAVNKETIKRYQKDTLKRQGPKIWDQWGNWSSCSVTCGIGKLARWRHCIGGSCSVGEKKAQLKTCTLAAC